MNISLQITANLAIVFEPFMPKIALKLAQMMAIKLPRWGAAGKNDLVNAGHQLNQPSILFAKIEDEQIQAQIDKLHQSTEKKSKFTFSNLLVFLVLLIPAK